jgi:hypothetical protein
MDGDRKEILIKELEIIQSVINRISSNSFLIKGWTITLVVGTLLLSGTELQIFIAFIPIFVFWILDSYYLWQERLYRQLYRWVIDNRLETDRRLFDMDTTQFKEYVNKPRTFFSLTLLLFYGFVLGVTIIYTIVIYYK